MNQIDLEAASAAAPKFSDPDITAKGERRAQVRLRRLETLWVNTGTLCNIECDHCYIESSPRNDRLVYFPLADLQTYLAEIRAAKLPVKLIGFTGGEPFMNPDMLAMADRALADGYDCLILTNAMQPMLRPAVRQGLADLALRYGNRLALRVSLDHYRAAEHDLERGAGSFAKALEGLRWISRTGIAFSVAGRTCWPEDDGSLRAGFARLFEEQGIGLDALDPSALLLFPEMDTGADVPEITVDCWGILNVDPDSLMCATGRMVVRRKGDDGPRVVACTLLPYEPAFELGRTLSDAAGSVHLNHPHCAKFCVLGGGSCTGN